MVKTRGSGNWMGNPDRPRVRDHPLVTKVLQPSNSGSRAVVINLKIGSPMKLTHSALLIGAAGLIWTGSARAAQHAIDTAKSTMTVHVSKAGALSAFGHDHDIAAPIAGGEVDPEAHRVELHLRSASLK